MANNNKAFINIHFLFILLFVSIGACSHAQHVTEEPDIRVLKSYFTEYYSQNETMRGYRIQISSTTNRREMERDLYKYKNLYPGTFNEWKHNAPYYRIIVGAFLTKEDAQKRIHTLRSNFSNSILVFDEISKDELLD